MRVRAVQRGYYLWLRYRGEEFVVPDHLFCDVWQEKLEDPVPEAPPPAVVKSGAKEKSK